MSRTATVERNTKETQIRIKLDVDGTGKSTINSKIGFFNHMLEAFAKHGLFDIEADIEGDLHIDQHHTVEDTGITLGMAFKEALGEKKGIRRAGNFYFPMDETLTHAAVDISGRAWLVLDAQFEKEKVGELSMDLIPDFLDGFTQALGFNLHAKVMYGRSDHHKCESLFKSIARALREACTIEERVKDLIPSTKGSIQE